MVVRQVKVGDILQLRRRRVLLEPAMQYGEIGLRSYGRGIFHKPIVSGSDLGTKKVYRIEPNDLVVSNVFGWEGALAVATEAERGLIGSHRFMTWSPHDETLVCLRYLQHYLLSDPGLVQLRRASPGSAGRNRTLGIAAFQGLSVPLPTFTEQQRIAAHLDRVDEAARAAAHSAAPGKDLTRQLPRFLHRVLTRAHLPTTEVRELCEQVGDLVRPGDDPLPATEFVGLEYLAPNTGVRLGGGPVKDLGGRKFRFRPGDVLYGYLRPYQNKVWVADRDGLCSVEQYVLRSRQGVKPELLGYALRSSTVLDYAIDQTNNLQLPRLGIRALMSARVPDIRAANPEIELALQSYSSSVTRAAKLMDTRLFLTSALLPAARNEAFANLT